jgi:hypothetical protein
MKYRIRKIDREIKRDIDIFREFTKQTIYKIMKHVESNHLSTDE